MNIKILATLGPSSTEESVVQKMDSSGVDMFRINLSHTAIEDLPKIIKDIQSWTQKPLCIDTEGAQIRTGKMKEGSILKKNTEIKLHPQNILGDELNIPLYPINPKEVLTVGDILTIDFDSVVIQITKINKENIYARVISGGKVSSNKGVDLDRKINLPALTIKDKKALEISKKLGLEYFALSFANKKEDVGKLRKFFERPVFIISKIETKSGIDNLKDICDASDAVLIDRGDLSREIIVQKIALAQKHIIDIAKKLDTPVYIATNLLDNMITGREPSRAEINDITSSLLSGARGLVLAAETAIGKNPIQSVKMISGIKKEVENYLASDDYFSSIYDYGLIEAHGGALVQNFINNINGLKNAPKIEVSKKILSDIVQIAEGTYSPLRGFMNKEELNSVINNYKLTNGVVWTLPILFQLNEEDIDFGRQSIIIQKDNIHYALMKVSNIEKIDLLNIAEGWFGTRDINHPGVANFISQGEYIVSGEVFLFKKPDFCLGPYALTPRQTRKIFRSQSWQKIVGFHTRNVIHRGHEYIQRESLDLVGADALFVSPIVGYKKPNDFSAEAILGSYEVMLKNDYYNPYPALMASFNTYSRYSGPREAVFTALCRKNFGCSHFIIGRDHTGVGDYYSANASQEIFKKIGDIGIQPIAFNSVYFCKICDKLTNKCEHKEEDKLKISGTKVRKCFLDNADIPDYLMRKDVFQSLKYIPKDKLFV